MHQQSANQHQTRSNLANINLYTFTVVARGCGSDSGSVLKCQCASVQQCVVVDVAVDVWRGSRLDKKRMQLNLNIPN